MKKKSIMHIIVRSFLKTIGIMILFLAIGVGSYYLTMFYYSKTDKVERSTAYTHVITVNVGNESSNLIYSFDSKTKKIKAMVLELFDQNTKNMTYVTIPASTQISLSGDTYTELVKASKKVPQVVKMSNLNEYFTGDVAYEYGILMLQDAMDIDIGYFTAVPSELFDRYFQKKSETEPLYMPSKTALQEIKDADDIEDLLDEHWEELISDTTLAQRTKICYALAQVNPDYIRVHGVYGKKSGKDFVLDGKKSARMVNNIWEADQYTSKQVVSKGSLSKSSSSKTGAAIGKKIWISNGSAINGLAANYQQKLKADGYNVIGVGNYQGQKQETTTIYAKEEDCGKDLQSYFPNAVVTLKTDLSNQADVEIVLGTDSALE